MSTELDPITSGYQLSKINTNFQKVEDALNNTVLRRDGLSQGEDNSMHNNLDMNSHAILNAVTDPTNDGSLITVEEFKRAVRVPRGETIAEAPAVADRRGKIAAWDLGNGNPIAVSPISIPSALAVELASSTGGSMIGLEQGGTVQHELQEVSVLAYGAKRDGVTDDTNAFIQAVAKAVQLGYRNVYVPAGTYVISSEVNLGGVGYSGLNGVKLRGDGRKNTRILFKPSATESPCFSIIGGHGTHTGRGVVGIDIYPYDTSYNNKGIGIYVNDASFVDIDSCDIGFLNSSIKLHNKSAGEFTEFINITRCRLDRSTYLLNMIVDAGDSSFHGVHVDTTQMQLGQGGVGLNMRSFAANRAHPYGCYFNIKLFGRSDNDCHAIYLQNNRCDISNGFFTLEQGAKFTSVDDSWFHIDGTLKGLIGGSNIIWNTPATNPQLGVPAHFIFDNMSSCSTLGNFTYDGLSSSFPQTWNPTFGESTDLSAPGFFRIRGASNTTNGMAWALRSPDTTGWMLGKVVDGQPWKSFTPLYKFDPGNVSDFRKLIGSSTSGRMYLSAFHTGTSVTSEVFVGVNRFSPGATNFDLGSASGERWGSGFFNGFTITSASIAPVVTNSTSFGTASLYPSNIYSQNAVTVVSDRNYKEQIEDLSDEKFEDLLEAIGSVKFKTWKLKSAVASKGDAARNHYGVIAQEVKEALVNKGIDWTNCGLITFERVTQPVTFDGEKYHPIFVEEGSKLPVEEDGSIALLDGADTVATSEDGTMTISREVYMLRMEEFLVLRTAFIESKLQGV